MNYVNSFLVKFNCEISMNEIPLFRGAVLKVIGDKVELLFHNHIAENQYRYKYPLIQYKRIHKKAAVFCIGEGVESIGQLLASQNLNMSIGEREVDFQIESLVPKRVIVQVWDTEFKYRVRNWIALNTENYAKYRELEGCGEQIAFLESILVGNILSFAKGMGITIDKQITCKLLELNKPKIVVAKGVKMMAFDVEFKSNISLPDYMGIGKHVSLGFGTVVRHYEKSTN